jgi:eukaryotic-like serine/threonine-protein kinase
MFPAPDHVLAGKYRLVRQLGQGGMGSVWLAEHLTLRSPVALKLIDPGIAANPEALARFLREAQAAASLRSPHVVQILDYGVDTGVPFIVMEVLEGESLAGRLARLGRLSPAETAKLMSHVARAMTRAHEAGVVHRDLKPDNIYIVHNDDDELAKVLDFGVAKSSLHGLGAAASSGTRTGAVLGTPYYMSPEQAEGTKAVDHRTDIWAMGVIAWECLLGTRPFEAETLGGLLLAICAREMPVPSRAGPAPPGFDAWFARACARDPTQRFATAKEAAGELRRVCGDLLVATQPWMPAKEGYAAGWGTTSPPLAGTTSNLVVSAPTLTIPTKKLSGPLVVAALLIGLVAAGVVGTLLLLGRSSPTAADSAPAAESRPPAAVAPIAVASNAPAPTLASTPAPAAPAPTAASSAAKRSSPNVPALAPPPASPAALSKSKAEPQRAAPARPPAPAARPTVNLGI